MQTHILSRRAGIGACTDIRAHGGHLYVIQKNNGYPGGRLCVLKRPNLLAVTVNPVAPSGFTLPSEVLVQAMERVFDVPVYDVWR